MARQLVQYIVVRADLLKTLNWPVGSVVAQACHACCAVTYLFQNDPDTQEYLKDLDNMHKVVLEVPDESSLRTLEAKLKENSILHKIWIEQPENIPTCIVVKPYPKEEVQKYFKKMRLLKDNVMWLLAAYSLSWRILLSSSSVWSEWSNSRLICTVSSKTPGIFKE